MTSPEQLTFLVPGSVFLGRPVAQPTFGGKTFDEPRDGARLRGQLERVWVLMRGGRWWTLGQLIDRAGGTTASISARVRDLRKDKFGGYDVERRRVPDRNGLWEYRIKV